MGDVIQFPARAKPVTKDYRLDPRFHAYADLRESLACRNDNPSPNYRAVTTDWKELLARGEEQAELDRLHRAHKQSCV